jgi:glycerophosphoryl diester phosphodiesterase
MKIMYYVVAFVLVVTDVCGQSLNRFRDAVTLDRFLQYQPNRKQPLILAHRGGPGLSETENSITTFSKTVRTMPDAILEMDVRLTRDSNYVLLHDATLDRESNATGAVADWALTDLLTVRLKTLNGELTDEPVQAFDDVLEWNQNRYVLALDVKPGTDPVRVMETVMKHKAEHSVFVICYSVADAQRMRTRFPALWLAVGVNSIDDLDRLEKGSLSTSRLVALTPQTPQTVLFYKRLHKLGVPCSIGTYGVGKLDEKPLAEAASDYKMLFKQGADILTTDRPQAVKTLF